ncbi:ribose-phosphate diphosphokinase [Granulosicoccaceae sp. 1_MG-2023]|nr:ribose-phosphate diphosphokinase [Granulosicoccaceae sp. 1_MG-2023]
MSDTAPKSSAMLIGFPDTASTVEALAGACGISCETIELRRFPDGESYVRNPAALPDHVVIFSSLHGGNDRLVELMLSARTARRAGVKRLSLLAPYLCYMRQDNDFNPGEAVSQTIVGEWFAGLFDDLLTIDPHLHRVGELANAMPVSNTCTLTASGVISDFLATRVPDDALILGPDAESEQWAKQIAAPRSMEYAISLKTRHGDRDVDVDVPEIDITDRDVVLIDDISSTGNTLIQAARQLEGKGARHVYAIVTHALLDEAAMQAMHEAGIEKIWSTDTIPHPTNVVSVEPVLHQALQTLLS